jgi:predicted  nucleic acid-binding Zn-ribbon protein
VCSQAHTASLKQENLALQSRIDELSLRLKTAEDQCASIRADNSTQLVGAPTSEHAEPVLASTAVRECAQCKSSAALIEENRLRLSDFEAQVAQLTKALEVARLDSVQRELSQATATDRLTQLQHELALRTEEVNRIQASYDAESSRASSLEGELSAARSSLAEASRARATLEQRVTELEQNINTMQLRHNEVWCASISSCYRIYACDLIQASSNHDVAMSRIQAEVQSYQAALNESQTQLQAALADLSAQRAKNQQGEVARVRYALPVNPADSLPLLEFVFMRDLSN